MKADKKPQVVVIDHYDSFTYNLVVAFENLGADVKVFRTNAYTEDIRKAEPTHIVLSPGPGHPKDVPLFQAVLEKWKRTTPILGVCLGHQAIGLHFGARVERCKTMMHGKTSRVTHNGLGIFEGLPENPLMTCRYHSLAVAEGTTGQVLLETAWSEDRVIMAVESVRFPYVIGVQFHPESHFTEYGPVLLKNFLQLEVAQRQSEPDIPVGFGQTRRSPTQ